MDLTPASRGGSGRAMSTKGKKATSPRSQMVGEKTFQAAVDSGVSGTHRNKKLTSKDLERIQNNPRAGRVIEKVEER